MKTMTLPEYIASIGDSRLAKDIGVTSGAVRNWRTCASVPYPKRAEKLIKHARGLLTIDSIYGDTSPVSPKKHVPDWKKPKDQRVKVFSSSGQEATL